MEAVYPETDEGWFCISRVGLIPDCTAHADAAWLLHSLPQREHKHSARFSWRCWRVIWLKYITYEYWNLESTRQKNCFVCVSMVTVVVPTICVTSYWTGCIAGQHPVYIVLWMRANPFLHERKRGSPLSHFRMRKTLEKEMPFLSAEETDPELSFKGEKCDKDPKRSAQLLQAPWEVSAFIACLEVVLTTMLSSEHLCVVLWQWGICD